MHLIDTSAWIHSLRPDGDVQVRTRVERLVLAGDACWCPMVRLELLNGARKDHERRVLREMEQRLIDLEITSETWRVAFDLARKARQKGLTVPATDIVIAACARHHGVGLEHADTHLASLEKIA